MGSDLVQLEAERVVLSRSAGQLLQLQEHCLEVVPFLSAGHVDVLRESAAAGSDEKGIPAQKRPAGDVRVSESTAEEDREDVLLPDESDVDSSPPGLTSQLIRQLEIQFRQGERISFHGLAPPELRCVSLRSWVVKFPGKLREVQR